MYQIYISRKNYKIQVKKLLKSLENGLTIPYLQEAQENVGEVIRYNENYYFSTSRKALLEYGRSIKQQWINELQEEMAKIKEIEV